MAPNGSADFAFIYGRWDVHNRKLRDNTDPTCTEWVEFAAMSDVTPILDGIGHIDRMLVPDPPDGDPFEGFTLRLYDPSMQSWSIWWSSTRVPGRLDPPVVGRFKGTLGIFECDDIVGGAPVQVRFSWDAATSSPVWRQAFSYNGGRSWTTNWVMTFTRD